MKLALDMTVVGRLDIVRRPEFEPSPAVYKPASG
jgi:hypothetical protein